MPPMAGKPANGPASRKDQNAGSKQSALASALGLLDGLRESQPSAEAENEAFTACRQVLRDGDEAARRQLGAAITGFTALPRDIALALASDQPSVSLPFIARSAVLNEDDLVKLVWSGDPAKQVTIAARPQLPAPVAAALTAVAGARVLTTLLANKSARIDADALQNCLDRFGDDETIQQGLIGRERLPLAVSEALLASAAPGLQQALLARHAVSPAVSQELQRRRGSTAPWWQIQIFSR